MTVPLKIGVLALQGDFAEHRGMLRRLGVDVLEVRLPGQLDSLDGLIIPGGESTVIAKLASELGLLEPLRLFAKRRAVWGSCAGAIFMARDPECKQALLGLLDVRIQRNAFGRQAESFVLDLEIACLAQPPEVNMPFPAVFIRAPLMHSPGLGVEVLAQLPDGKIVAVRQGHCMTTSFHPELTDDLRFHACFLALASDTLHAVQPDTIFS